MRLRPPAFGDVFEVRVTLRYIEPAVWRALRVPSDLPLAVLFDPERFDASAVNKKLAALSKRVARWRKSGRRT